MSAKKTSEYKIAVFGALAGVLFTAIYDLIKSKPILSTLWILLKWVWKNIFEFELTIWQILIVVLVIALISLLLKTKREEPKAKFTDYRRDVIHGTEWVWSWEHNLLENKWEVHNITPICDNCGTRMKFEFNYGVRSTAKCPRCDNRQTGLKDRETIEALIIDNIHQDLHLNKIKKE